MPALGGVAAGKEDQLGEPVRGEVVHAPPVRIADRLGGPGVPDRDADGARGQHAGVAEVPRADAPHPTVVGADHADGVPGVVLVLAARGLDVDPQVLDAGLGDQVPA